VYDDKVILEQKENQSNKHVDKLMTIYIDIIINKFKKVYKEKISELNDKYEYCLLGLNNSWDDIPFYYWIYIDKMWWDIRTLNNTFTSQLNQTELENPYPIYLENPFTRNKISIDEISKIKYHNNVLKKYVNLDVHISLEKFIDLSKKILDNIHRTTNQYDTACKIIKQFSKTLRFKTINYKDSQGRYCGYWVDKKEPLSTFETYYRKAISVSMIPENNIHPFFSAFIYQNVFKIMDELDKEEYNF